MTEPALITETREGISTLTLNRPAAMNALSVALRAELARAFRSVSEDPDVGVVILTGAGERAFSAGLDLKELGGETAEAGGVSGTFDPASDPVHAMEACPKPIIGAINGVAITGGFELALACDVLIGSPNARFADTHARVGILPGWGLSQRLARTVGPYRAKEISLTGNFVDADRAERIGLLVRVVPAPELMDHCRGLARDMLSCRPGMVTAYKAVIDRGFAATLAEGMALERETSRTASRGVSPDEIAAARREVTARGRRQIH